MNAVTRHELIGIGHRGHLCACGELTRYWADHLYLISLEALGEPPEVIDRARTALHQEQQRLRETCPPECPITTELRRLRKNALKRTLRTRRHTAGSTAA